LALIKKNRFLLVQIYIDLLDDKMTPNDIRSALRVFQKQSPGLNEDEKSHVLTKVYEQTMDRIFGQKRGQINLAINVFSWLTYAKRQLTTSELQHALATKLGTTEFDQDDMPCIDDMVSVCAGLVTVDEESRIIRLVHYTTQEYFQEQKHRILNAETKITNTCLTYLSFDAFENGACHRKELEERLRLYQLYDYAACNWGHHSHATEMPEKRLIFDFLQSEAKTVASYQAMHMSGPIDPWLFYDCEGMKGIQIHLAAHFGSESITAALLKNGHGANARGLFSQTPLHVAAAAGQGAIAELLLKNRAKVNVKDTEFYRTPLHLASKNGHESIARLLLEQGANIKTQDFFGRTPLHLAADDGHLAVVRLLLQKGADIDIIDHESKFMMMDYGEFFYGGTPLCLAAMSGHEAIVRLLLEKGAHIEAENDTQMAVYSPLFLACWMGHEAVARLLIEKGAAGIEEYEEGTPLCYAAREGHTAIVRLLLEKGANIEAEGYEDWSPLSIAVLEGHTAIIGLLLKKGANTEVEDCNGKSPLSLAALNRYIAIVRLLLEKGANIESEDYWGGPLLYYAAEKGYTAIIRLLLEKGANIKSEDRWCGPPLSLAASNGHTAIVRLLLEKGANVKAKGYEDWSPLSLAVLEGHTAIVGLLLEKGANTEVEDCNG
jgi:ankyrin repeat protein